MLDQASGRWMKNSLAVIGFVGLGVGCYLAGRSSTSSLPPWGLSPIPLNASATDSGQEFAIATGPVSDEADGFFVLDFATGQLTCSVLYPRTKVFGANFATNVKEFLPGDPAKGGSKFLLVTGRADMGQGGNGIVYVLDTVSGGYAAFGVPFNRSMVAGNRPQANPLVLISKGTARGVPDRSR